MTRRCLRGASIVCGMDTKMIWTTTPEVMATELPDAVVILDEGGEMYQLSGVARAIWLALPADLETLTATVTAQFEVGVQAAQADISAFLSEMTQKGLLTQSG
ncbi:PqqD family protein (plasmid) [Deinococcus psychrotolerans]|uniref:PqqD family protein n=2 Tax=Deinococcus psychrotolerans TaxID=2489213 RepID=A0A3G8YGT4_9DEIO|nr:PqqD family protein [Deinococcus psychrotolerans]